MYSISRVERNDSFGNPWRSPSPYEPEKSIKIIKRSAIILLIIALILVIALVVSIALVFTIGWKATQQPTNTASSTSATSFVNSLYEPCACGCPSIEPLFNDRTSETARVVNGETARAHSWPWQMLLMIFDIDGTPSAYCGSTLITDRHILTAAHCVHKQFPPFIFAFPAQHALDFSISPASAYQVNKVFIHEGYNVLLHDDIAIVTLEEPLRFDSQVRPICLATPKSPLLQDKEELVATGWGRISGEPETQRYPANLQQVKLAYVPTSHPNCSELFQSVEGAHPGQMCAGKPGFNICQGDSGGPLVRRVRMPNTETYYWQQVGIVSATKDCGWNSTNPDVFVNVPYYYDWIVSTIRRAV